VEGSALYDFEEILAILWRSVADAREIHEIKLAHPGCKVFQLDREQRNGKENQKVTIPRDEIQTFTVVPDGIYLVRVEELEQIFTKGGENAKLPAGVLMYNLVTRIMEPPEFSGLRLGDMFVVGTADDKLAKDPETWKAAKAIGCQRLEKLLKAAGVETAEDDPEIQPNIMTEIVDQQCLAQAFKETDDGSRDPRYKGMERNRIAGWYPVGDREIGIAGGPRTAGTAKRPAAGPAIPAARTPAVPETVPSSPPPVQSETPTVRRPVPRRTTAPPAQAPPTAEAKTSVAPPVRKTAKSEVIPCERCEPAQDIPRDQFRDHQELHNEADKQE